MRRCDRANVFVFPSIRELGAGVIVEAMASAMACVVANYGAPGALVGTDRGITVPLGSKNEMTENFGHALVPCCSVAGRHHEAG